MENGSPQPKYHRLILLPPSSVDRGVHQLSGCPVTTMLCHPSARPTCTCRWHHYILRPIHRRVIMLIPLSDNYRSIPDLRWELLTRSRHPSVPPMSDMWCIRD